MLSDIAPDPPPGPQEGTYSDPDFRPPGGVHDADPHLVCPDCGKCFAPAAGDLSLVRPPLNRDVVQEPAQLTLRCPHCGTLRAVHWGERRESV